MEMEMKKMKSTEPRDRLSELPDSLIFNIFEFLTMNDVVGTQILSHRWKHLWTITPYLNFYNKYANIDKFRNFVNRCLLHWRGKMIQKFVVLNVKFDKSMFSDMDLWVLFAVDNGVEELITSFNTQGSDPYEVDYRVPKCLYSCSWLQELWCYGSIMEINGNVVRWNRLKKLGIQAYYGITQHAIDLVLSMSPILELFFLTFFDKDTSLRLSIRSTSLKKLYVKKICKNVDISMDTELSIWTPNLETLTICGAAYGKCLLMDVSSLTHANLEFNRFGRLGATLSEILPTIRHVKGLTLSNCCIQVLGIMNIHGLLSPLSCVVCLELNGSFQEHERIVGLLDILPKLKTLVLEEESKHINPKSKKKRKFKPNPSKSFLVELRTIKVAWTMHDFSIFPLIKILLKYASKLEKMVFELKDCACVPAPHLSYTLFLASQKLLKMPRSSPTSKLILC